MSSTGEGAGETDSSGADPSGSADPSGADPSGSAESTDAPALAVDGLTKRYGDTVALDGVDLDVDDGEFVAVVGPSGCGKSTLLRVLSGLESGFGGTVEVDGRSVSEGGSDAVGMVFQEPRLLAWADVRENVAVGLPADVDPGSDAARERIDELIRTVGLDGFASHRPGELSGGMAQRVSLARGLAYEPAVLLLDEPFSALDRLTKHEQQDNLLDVWTERETTVVLVTHDVEEATYLADRVVVLGGQPGSVEDVIDVDVDRPRERTDEALLDARDAVTAALGV